MTLSDAFEAPGDGPAMLLLHGFTGSPYELRPLATRFAALGFRVRAPLLPGHGTTPQRLSRLCWRDFCAAARAHFDALAEGGRPVVVGGLSMGALLALDLALDPVRSSKIAALMSFATALRLPAQSRFVLSRLRLLGESMPDVYMPKRGGPDVRDPAVARETPAYKVLPMRAARELLVAREALVPRLGALTTPLLAVHGMLDRTCSVEGSMELVRAARGKERALVLLPGSGHLVTVDVERDEVERQAVAFVSRHA